MPNPPITRAELEHQFGQTAFARLGITLDDALAADSIRQCLESAARADRQRRSAEARPHPPESIAA